MGRIVLTNNWMIQTITLYVNLAMGQKHLLHFFIGN